MNTYRGKITEVSSKIIPIPLSVCTQQQTKISTQTRSFEGFVHSTEESQ